MIRQDQGWLGIFVLKLQHSVEGNISVELINGYREMKLRKSQKLYQENHNMFLTFSRFRVLITIITIYDFQL